MGTDTGALKYDEDKLRYDLIPPIPLEHLAQVYTFGAKKYGDRNWEKGLSFDRLFAALQRHIMERKKGNFIDPESKLPHMASVIWCAMAIDHFDWTPEAPMKVNRTPETSISLGFPSDAVETDWFKYGMMSLPVQPSDKVVHPDAPRPSSSEQLAALESKSPEIDATKAVLFTWLGFVLGIIGVTIFSLLA